MSSFNQKPHHSIKKIILLSSKHNQQDLTEFSRYQNFKEHLYQFTYINTYIQTLTIDI